MQSISVVIAVYNAADHLQQCLRHLVQSKAGRLFAATAGPAHHLFRAGAPAADLRTSHEQR